MVEVACQAADESLQWKNTGMLTTLRIKNLALADDLTLELQPGYNVITGETGAGKSILIGALNLVLGERADRSLIRTADDETNSSCSVEVVFDTSNLKAPLASFLAQNGIEPCEAGQLVLKRSFTNAGANRQFVNGSPTTLGLLTTIGEWLVDIHGPHEHQSLLHPAGQLTILDAFGKLEAQRETFAAGLRRRSALLEQRAALVVDEKTYAHQLDLLRFQVQEINAARLQPNEAEQLEQEYHRVSNAARLLQLGQAALDLLGENETSLLTQAGIVGRTLQELQRIDASAAPLSALHEQAVSAIGDLQTDLARYLEKVEVDPARLQQLEERLNLLQMLKRKYGPTLAEVMAFGQVAEAKLEALVGRDAELTRLNADLQKAEAELLTEGQSLSAKRRKTIPQLTKAVNRQLADLGFKQSRFDVALISLPTETPQAQDRPGQNTSSLGHFARVTSSGLDSVEFEFAPNPGEPAKPLRAIASSGELARVMLALKTVLAAEDQVPVLIFDEVDANIGGVTAHAVGEKMRQIAQRRQVLCITHLPQVAAVANAHYRVTKQVRNGRTVSQVTFLEKEARVTELARMLGGQSTAARNHAEALLR